MVPSIFLYSIFLSNIVVENAIAQCERSLNSKINDTWSEYGQSTEELAQIKPLR